MIFLLWTISEDWYVGVARRLTKSLGGNRDDCLKSSLRSEVDGIKSELDKHSQAESIDRDASLFFNLAEEVRERQSARKLSVRVLSINMEDVTYRSRAKA